MEQHIKSFGNFVEAWPYCEGHNIAEVWVGRGTSALHQCKYRIKKKKIKLRPHNAMALSSFIFTQIIIIRY